MICYKDMTFCTIDINNCCNEDCSRYPTPGEKLAASSLGLPMAYSDFSKDCDRYIPHPKEEE